MTKDVKTGGPAFPGPIHPLTYSGSLEGMSLRDWFAGMALQGYRSQKGGHLFTKESVVSWAYQDADAMIQERDK